MKNKPVSKSFIAWCKKHFKDDLDKIDVKAHYDKFLSVDENKTLFKEKFGVYFKGSKPELSAKERKKKETREAFDSNKQDYEERFGVEVRVVV